MIAAGKKIIGVGGFHPQVGGIAEPAKVKPSGGKVKTPPAKGFIAEHMPKAADAGMNGLAGLSRFGTNPVDLVVRALSFGTLTEKDLACMFQRDCAAGILWNAHLNDGK